MPGLVLEEHLQILQPRSIHIRIYTALHIHYEQTLNEQVKSTSSIRRYILYVQCSMILAKIDGQETNKKSKVIAYE